MKVDARFTEAGFATVTDAARRFEAAGYDAVWAPESRHDPFLPLAVAAGPTERVRLGTSVAVAFARTPMTMAYPAWDLQLYTGGRFVLGLGSQVKAHVERRFGMPWTAPAPRMREFIAALRAIWQSWQDGTRLDWASEHYRHSLNIPTFTPEPLEHGPPPIYLAAVGPGMTRLAGEAADGLFAHAFNTATYLREVTAVELATGLARAERERASFELAAPVYVATGETAEARAEALRAVRAQIALYGSTPAYHRVLEHHGWGELARELHALSRERAWVRMGEILPDDVVHEFAIVAEPDGVAEELVRRYDGVADRVSFHAPYTAAPELWERILADVKARPSR
ncbi:MAG TPA: TIGR03617 family F420-dependent LLM class oxidoreductase [Solirubrobacter sp.]|nr:TIGR03617 family F420-dependent LLM class oxidoreductase [Solirubrobacter sp.]